MSLAVDLCSKWRSPLPACHRQPGLSCFGGSGDPRMPWDGGVSALHQGPPQSCPEAQCSSRSWRTPVGAGMSPGPAFRVHGSLCGLGCPQECFCMTPLRCPVLALRPCSLWGVRQKGRDMPQPTSQGWCCAQAQGPQDWPGLPGVGQQWPLAGSPRCPSTWDRGARGSAGLCQVPRVTV